ncbi:hypothetical protein AB0A73_12950 [Glycomyces sp. NPDC047369]
MSAFERVRAITAYCDTIEEQLAAADPAAPELESAVEWLEWALSHAAEIDPLQALPAMPAAPAFTAEQLAPHLKDAESSALQGDRLRSTQPPRMDPALMMLQLQAEKLSFRRWHPHV